MKFAQFDSKAEAQTTPASLDLQQSPKPPSDSFLLAVLSLEAAETPDEFEQSLQRITTLGIPPLAPPPPLTSLSAIEKEEDTTPATPVTTNVREDPRCAETGSAAFCVYTVVAGDTLSGIASRFGVTGNGAISAAEMIAQSNKPDVFSTDEILPGQNLRIPRQSGIIHTVFSSETLNQVAARYGVTVNAIMSSPYNNIPSSGMLQIGQEILVPDPQQLPVNESRELIFEPEEEATPEATPQPTRTPEATPQATRTPEATSQPTRTPQPTATPEPVVENEADEEDLAGDAATTEPPPMDDPADEETPTATPAFTATATAAAATPTPTATPRPRQEATATPTPRSGGSSLLIWPTQGPISSYFGPSHPLGIDIDLYADPNADIVAARGGEVVFVGGDACCSYGYYVIVDHGNGLTTLYAHFSQIVVRQGQRVTQGQLLGYGGRTGYATGNHLHFEVRIDGAVVDPMLYLPPR